MARWIVPLVLFLASVGAFWLLLPRQRTTLGLLLARRHAAAAEADAPTLYRLAEEHYRAGDRDHAEELCRRSLDLDPRRAGPAALLLELSLLRGGNAAPEWPSGIVGCSQIEISCTYERGVRYWHAGDLDRAETEFRRVLEWAKWLPESRDLAEACAGAEAMLEVIGARR